MDGRVSRLVVDTTAFLNNVQLHEFADEIYTLQEVVREIKDLKTKERLQVLPYELIFKQPSPESITAVTNFSKKTGDFPTLSPTDIKVLALTYQLHVEKVGIDSLRTEPQKLVDASFERQNEISTRLPGFYVPSSNWEDSGEVEEINDEGTDDLGGDEDEDENWVTPENVHEVMKAFGLATVENNPVVVGCITADFAMQNVLLQMGLKVIAANGRLIRHAKTFILRCYGCFKTTSNMMSKFCPHCGNATLKRVQVDVDENGEVKIRINFRRPLTSRGKKFSLPMPKGGKHSVDPILCADQPIPHNRLSKKALLKTDALHPDYLAGVSPFAINDVTSRSANLGVQRCGRMVRGNPNKVRNSVKSHK
ncbi:hypothetical protein CHUAL_013109 [Chamberlinius hualienensis]